MDTTIKIRNEACLYSTAHDMLYFASLYAVSWLNFTAIICNGGGVISAAIAAALGEATAAIAPAIFAAIAFGCSGFERAFGYGPSIESHRQSAIAYMKVKMECENTIARMKATPLDPNALLQEETRLRNLLEREHAAQPTDGNFLAKAKADCVANNRFM